MNNVEAIVNETIGVLLAPYTLYDPMTYLCPYHQEDKVRSVIHSMLRMEACRVYKDGVLSPCFPSKGFRECKNNPCPYIIGHSIYLWVGYKREALHKGESGGCGCTFKHSKQEIMEIRDRVFRILDAEYGMYNVIESSPLRALTRIQLFYYHVIQQRIANGASMEITSTFNVTTMKPFSALLFKSDDTIFVAAEPPTPEEESDEEYEEDSEDKKFPSIAAVYEDPVVNGSTNRKSPSTRKDLPYQMDGL